MPGPGRFRTPAALEAMCQGSSGTKYIDSAFENMLTFVERASKKQVSPEEGMRDTPEDRLLNYKVATEAIVLLKNKTHTLPLSASNDDIAVIGPNAKLAAAGGGGGSAAIRPYYTTSVYEGIAKYVAPEKIHYEVGAYGHLLLPLFNSSDITNEDGQAGVTIKFFNEPYAVLERQSFDQITLPDATYQLMDYHHASAKKTFYISMRFSFTPTQTGVYDFGLGVYGTADLLINDELVIDNTTTAQESGRLFFGRGSTEKRAGYHMKARTTYSIRVEAGNASTAKDPNPHPITIPGGACRLGGCLHIDRDESIQRAVDIAKKCKHTILVVGLNVCPLYLFLSRQH
jgi:beta-glucosidase